MDPELAFCSSRLDYRGGYKGYQLSKVPMAPRNISSRPGVYCIYPLLSNVRAHSILSDRLYITVQRTLKTVHVKNMCNQSTNILRSFMIKHKAYAITKYMYNIVGKLQKKLFFLLVTM